MKKYMPILFVVTLLGFSNLASAMNCASGEYFNTTTGQSCGNTTTVSGCQTGFLFSPVTGQSCSGVKSEVSSSGISLNRELKIGSRGDDVKRLQQLLKELGILLGKIDGSYGPITARAVKEFQEDYGIAITGNVDATTLPKINIIKEPVPPPCNTVINFPEGGGGTMRYCPPETNNNSPVISGVNGPQSLNVNQQGTWGVTASDPNGGTLYYSVLWGDEVHELYTRAQSSLMKVSQQSASFTHSYSQRGVYTPIFTVANSSGQNAQASLSVNVGGSTSVNNAPNIISKSPMPEIIRPGETINFSWIATDADNDNLAWSVDWGDNGAEAGACQINAPQNGANQNFYTSHSWINVGRYNVKVVVSDCKGGIDEISFIVNVGDTITVPQSLTVLSPNGGETWTQGTTQTIKWQDNTTINCPTYTNGLRIECSTLFPRYDITLNEYHAPCTTNICPAYPYRAPYTITKSVYGSSYDWTIPKCDASSPCSSNFEIATGSYTVQICQSGTSICDSSDSYFKIINVVSAPTYRPGCTSNYGWSSTTGEACDGSTIINPVVNVTANPSTVSASGGTGGASTVIWSSIGSNLSCTIWPEGGLVSSSGSKVVYPSSTTNYSVNCKNSSGVVGIGSATVNVVTPAYRPGCSSSTSGYSSVDGQSCILLAGCSSYYGYSSYNGESCTTS